MATHYIDCSEPWFSLVKEGKKPVEGRKNSETWSELKVGDTLIFRCKEKTFPTTITGINLYTGEDPLKEFLETETLSRALPGKKTLEEGAAVYLQWSKLDEIKKMGFLGIQVTVNK
jgi:ASC-1-like (ASCH) protein